MTQLLKVIALVINSPELQKVLAPAIGELLIGLGNALKANPSMLVDIANAFKPAGK